MVFSSQVFLFIFLPVVLLLYYRLPARWRNGVALAASYFFYAWGAPKLVFLLAASSAFDYLISRHFAAGIDRPARQRRRLLTLAIGVNLAGLLYFKYANFFVGEVQSIMTALGMDAFHWTHIALPIGISFFTFQKISYLVDVYRGTAKPARSLTDYMLYVALFPQLIAGPIVRYHDIAKQLSSRAHTYEKFLSGACRFCLGLGKKVLIANVMGEVADRAFAANAADLSSSMAWVGVVCYAFQIYFDFSGYSDMAIGLGRMLGFEFLENFNCPYISRNFTEFWKRWHISLSNWMREYLYIPLGGNRVGPVRAYTNLWIVFLFSGFWHGAAWNFIVWGAYHGFFMSLDKALKPLRLERIPRLAAIPVTFVLVLFSWVLFRAPDLGHATDYMAAMLGASGAPASAMTWDVFINDHARLILIIAAALSFLPVLAPPPVAVAAAFKTRGRGPAQLLWKFAGAVVLLILSAAALTASTFNPFIYFRF